MHETVNSKFSRDKNNQNVHHINGSHMQIEYHPTKYQTTETNKKQQPTSQPTDQFVAHGIQLRWYTHASFL